MCHSCQHERDAEIYQVDSQQVSSTFIVLVCFTLLRRVWFDLQTPRRSAVNSLFQTLHWLSVEQRINYKLAVTTFKTQHTSSPLCTSVHNTRSSSVPLLRVPFCRMIVRHSLPPAILNCDLKLVCFLPTSAIMTLYKFRIIQFQFGTVSIYSTHLTLFKRCGCIV